MTSVYIFLGAAGSGRRTILADLVTNALDGPVCVYQTNEFDGLAPVPMPPAAEIRNWGVANGRFRMDSPETVPETVFLLTDGRQDPADQMEILVAAIRHLGWQVARVITVVNCALVVRHPELELWYKACVHFSDVALLACRDGVENSQVRKFVEIFKADYNPCLFEYVKKGRVENGAKVLVPEARRLSLIFDDTDPLDYMEFDEDNLPDEPFDLTPGKDPYFERLPNGLRCRPLPPITAFLQTDA